MNAPTLATIAALALLGLGAPFASTWGPGPLAGAMLLGIYAAFRSRCLSPAARWTAWAVAAVAPLALLTTFTVNMAAPNVVSAGQKATERMAVASLRTMVWAQDQFIKRYGRAGLIGELVGAQGVDGGPPIPAPLLRPPYRDLRATPRGHAAPFQGYVFAVHAGGATDQRGAIPAGTTQWTTCAWPQDKGVSAAAAFCINQDEDIIRTANGAPNQGYNGWQTAPAPGAWITGTHGHRLRPGTGADGGQWTWWRGKRTRRSKAAD
jgi:hypothetical protein